MKQSSLGLGTLTKRTRRREFLEETDRLVPWSDLVAEIESLLPEGKHRRPTFPVEALHDMPLFYDFAGLGVWNDRLPDESTILRFRYVLEKNKLVEGILATGNLLLGTKGLMLRSGTVVNSGLVDTVRGTAGHVNDVIEANSLSRGQETDVFAYACYQGTHKWPNAKENAQSHVARRRGLRKLLDNAAPMDTLTEQVECVKASIRAKVEAPVRPCEGALSRFGQEHGTAAHAFCVGQSVDGAQAFDRKPGMNTPGAWEIRERRTQKTSQRPVISVPPNHGQRSFVQTFLRPSGYDK